MDDVLQRYERGRERSRALFGLLKDDVYYDKPIHLRNPVVFYDGHLPGFAFNVLVKKALGGKSIDPNLERLFARGIDPHERAVSAANGDSERSLWPDRQSVQAFTAEADRQVADALTRADLSRPGDPMLDNAEAVYTILEHEELHHETLLYMWHRLPFDQKRRPSGYAPRIASKSAASEWLDVPGGEATLGVDRGTVKFGWDNEFPLHRQAVGSFAIERFSVTNARFHDFVDAGGYHDPQWWRPADWAWLQEESFEHPLFWERHGGEWFWRGMFELIPLPSSWPVYVTHAEASAFAKWRGARLPTEAEFQRAAYGSPSGDRPYAWGTEPPTAEHGVFNFSSWDPEPAGAHPAGRSAWGVEDLVGNGWEWTSTAFAPFPGFRPMPSYPEYSADFFDGEHFVIKGASPVTARELLRPTFRNWFRARYPYVYGKFRCVR